MKLKYTLEDLSEDSFKTLWEKKKSFQLQVLDPTNLETKQIPLSATAMRVEAHDWKPVQLQAEALVRCVKSLWGYLQKNLDPKNLAFFTKGLQEEEIEFSNKESFLKRSRVTMRVDYFYEGDGSLKILELNTTIPTMQGYSDIALRSMAEARDLDYKKFFSNTEFLAETIQYNFEQERKQKLESLLILTRKNDPQSFEMQYLQNTWKQLYGWRVVHGDAELVDTIAGKEKLLYYKEEYDACYRHIFFWRLKKNSALKRALLAEHRHAIYNPISSCLELKALSAILSHVIQEKEVSKHVGISEQDRQSLLDAFPECSVWIREESLTCFSEHKTRMLKRMTPDWKTIESNPQDFVLKPNFGYGGQSVVIGAEIDRDPVQEKVKRMMQIPASSSLYHQKATWADLLEWVKKQEPFSWVVQKRVQGRKEEVLVLKEDQTAFRESRFVDLNVFVGEGESLKAGGGVVRFSPNVIVNIAQGGGILPLLIGK